MVDIADVVTYTNFGEHRLKGFWVAGVKFPPLPLTFIVALTTLSHYRASMWSVCLSVRFFVGATRHSFGAILTRNGSNDVISQPLVPFDGHINIAPH